MIFRQWELVLSGRKTQTRRLWKPVQYAPSGSTNDEGVFELFAVYGVHGAPPLFEIGKLLPVIPKRTYPAIRVDGEIQRVRVCRLRQERLQDISEADAIAEGVNSVEEYRELWESINGKTKGARWTDNPEVLVITFEMVKHAEPTRQGMF